MALVLHHSKAKGTSKLVLVGIANHAGDGGAWPSIATLAKYANVTERNVQKAIGQLVQLGELAVQVQGGGTHQTKDRQRPNRYDVLLACPPACDRTASHRLRDLPTAQAGLWISGVSETTPGVGDDTRGVSETTPGGVSQATPEPSIEPSINPSLSLVPQPQNARTVCKVCSLTFDQCVIRARTNGHDFTPAKPDPRAEVDRVLKHYGADGVAGS